MEVSRGAVVLSEECPDYHRRSGHQGWDEGRAFEWVG